MAHLVPYIPLPITYDTGKFLESSLLTSGVARNFSRGARGEEFPQNVAVGGKLPNLFELNNTVNEQTKIICHS